MSKSLTPLLIVGAIGAFFLTKKSPKTTSSSSNSNKDTSEYEHFPDDIDVKINEENIYKYYSKTPTLIKNIPFIYSDLNLNLQVYLDPQSEFGNEKAYVYITPELASQTWGYAKTLLGNYPNQYSGKTDKEASDVARAILIKFAPDVYWQEGLDPYKYGSAFTYVFSSVRWLVRIAYADLNNLNQDTIPANIGL
jgi:hypothetical protein